MCIIFFKILNVVNMEEASLCEPGVKYFIGRSLKESHKFKENYTNFFYNVGMFFVFFGGVVGFLVYRYKGRITVDEMILKKRQKQEYILNKIQNLAAIKEKQNNEMITNLPTWSDNPEIDMLKRYA